VVGQELDACRWLLAPHRVMRELLGPKMVEKPHMENGDSPFRCHKGR
jgi:hypothetical protein